MGTERDLQLNTKTKAYSHTAELIKNLKTNVAMRDAQIEELRTDAMKRNVELCGRALKILELTGSASPARSASIPRCVICLGDEVVEATWSFVHGRTAHLALCEECHGTWSHTAQISAQLCPVCREPYEKIVN